MHGYRIIGQRKGRLIQLVLKELSMLAAQGINGIYILEKNYGMKGKQDWHSITTKRISGMISDLRELRNT